MRPSLFLLILFLCIAPVSGYSVLDTYSLENDNPAAHYGNWLFVNNVTSFHSVTKIDFDTVCQKVGSPPSTQTGEFKADYNSTPQGTWTWEWDCPTSMGAGSIIVTLTHTNDQTVNSHGFFTWVNTTYSNNAKNWQLPLNKTKYTASTISDQYKIGAGYHTTIDEVVGLPGTTTIYGGTAMELPSSDFVGSPLIATAPKIISLIDNSTGPATTWNWSGSGPGDLFFSSLTTQNTTVYLMTAGNYTISHGAENALGSDIETKTDYIYIYDDNSTSSTGCLAVNGATGIRIAGAQVDMYDIENTSWTNTTTTEGLGLITTMKGHTIDCYGSAVGFDPGDLLAQPEKHLGFYTLNLWPSVGYKNVSAGYVTLYITVTDISTGNPIAGATVSGGGKNYGVLLNSSAFSLTTNEQGMASVPVPNGTFIYMTAYKSGYSTQTAAVDTGTGSGGDAKVTYWFKMSKATTGPTAAITTLPGGGYPTTSPTVDPAGTPDPSGKGGGGYSTAKGQQMMDYLAQNGMDLVQLCFIVTILALVGVKFGK